MADNEARFAGNLTRDPELRFTTGGQAVCSFTVASNRRYMQNNEWKDAEPVFVDCTVWGQFGENVGASLAKGDRVVVSGRIETRQYEDKDQITRRVWQVVCDEVAVSLKFATAEIARAPRSGGERPAGEQPAAEPSQPRQGAPANPQYADEAPF